MNETSPVARCYGGERVVHVLFDIGFDLRCAARARVEAPHIIVERYSALTPGTKFGVNVEPKEYGSLVVIDAAAASFPSIGCAVEHLGSHCRVRHGAPSRARCRIEITSPARERVAEILAAGDTRP